MRKCEQNGASGLKLDGDIIHNYGTSIKIVPAALCPYTGSHAGDTRPVPQLETRLMR